MGQCPKSFGTIARVQGVDGRSATGCGWAFISKYPPTATLPKHSVTLLLEIQLDRSRVTEERIDDQLLVLVPQRLAFISQDPFPIVSFSPSSTFLLPMGFSLKIQILLQVTQMARYISPKIIISFQLLTHSDFTVAQFYPLLSFCSKNTSKREKR